MVLTASTLLLGANVPDDVPVPLPRPDAEAARDVPEAAPREVRDKGREDSSNDEEKPSEMKTGAPEEQEDSVVVPPEISKEAPREFSDCIAGLTALGVEFSQVPGMDDGNGCGIDRPLVVTRLAPAVKVSPAATLRCETTLQLARWTQSVVIPMLKIARPGAVLTEVKQASAYVCRKRNNAETGKISEHARGNAIDIAAFSLSNDEIISIAPRLNDSTMEGAFQRAVSAAACLHFTTVLDPSSDKAHETHLHLDVLERKDGYRYCW